MSFLCRTLAQLCPLLGSRAAESISTLNTITSPTNFNASVVPAMFSHFTNVSAALQRYTPADLLVIKKSAARSVMQRLGYRMPGVT